LELARSIACNGIGVPVQDDDALDARIDEGIGARGGAPIVTARFERYVNIRAACRVTGFFESGAFGVVFATADVRSFSDDLAVFDNYRTDGRIGMRFTLVAPRKNERPLEKLCIVTARCRPPQ